MPKSPKPRSGTRRTAAATRASPEKRRQSRTSPAKQRPPTVQKSATRARAQALELMHVIPSLPVDVGAQAHARLRKVLAAGTVDAQGELLVTAEQRKAMMAGVAAVRKMLDGAIAAEERACAKRARDARAAVHARVFCRDCPKAGRRSPPRASAGRRSSPLRPPSIRTTAAPPPPPPPPAPKRKAPSGAASARSRSPQRSRGDARARLLDDIRGKKARLQAPARASTRGDARARLLDDIRGKRVRLQAPARAPTRGASPRRDPSLLRRALARRRQGVRPSGSASAASSDVDWSM